MGGVCDESYCDKSGAPQVCQKMQVLHVNHMSRSAGVLVVKRSSCGADGKCSVFKAGLCIDLRGDQDARNNVWSSIVNVKGGNTSSIADADGGMITQAMKFGRLATNLLKKHNNTLPEKYACSDSRHRWMKQTKPTRRRRIEREDFAGGWHRWMKTKKTNPQWRCWGGTQQGADKEPAAEELLLGQVAVAVEGKGKGKGKGKSKFDMTNMTNCRWKHKDATLARFAILNF